MTCQDNSREAQCANSCMTHALRLIFIHNWQDDEEEEEEASSSRQERVSWQPKGRGKHAASHATTSHQLREAIRKPLLMKIKFIQGKLDQSQSRVETLSSELGVQTALAQGAKDSIHHYLKN